jgi:cation diffusion facilitator CzcD-associated flavoprotein CzcO
MTSAKAKQHVGIMGCGASGLVTLKELHAEGHTGIIFERTSSIGGVFNTVYQQGFMVSSTVVTMFSDFYGSESDQALTHPRMLSFGMFAFIYGYLFITIRRMTRSKDS